MLLSQAFQVRNQEVIALVGGGGKTTVMFRLAGELAAQGQRVIITTTTHLFAGQVSSAPRHLVYSGPEAATEADFLKLVEQTLASSAAEPLLLVGPVGEEDKVAGIPPRLIDQLAARGAAGVIVVEADGARMRPFKAPAAHEPVVPTATTLYIPVIGIAAIGARLDAEHVHRPERVAELAGARLGEPVTAVMAARVLAHPEGGLKGKPAQARAIVLVNQIEGAAGWDKARALARQLLGFLEIDAVALGAAGSAGEPISEVHRRVAAVVVAAGPGTRMQGHIKQLLPWRGKTLVENAIAIALQSTATEPWVLLGAHSEEVRAVVRALPVRIAINPAWAEGHASSIRAAVRALPPSTEAAIFINADQPLLTTAIVDGLLQRYRETGARIVAPLYSGKRGSPVLFDRVHFPELANLQGEQGGRELLARYPDEIEWVEFADALAGTDVDTWEEYDRLLRQTGQAPRSAP